MTEFQRTVFIAAQNLFARHGYEGTSISDIAAKAGVAKSTVLHHFTSKLRLYQRVMKHSIDQFSGILSTHERETVPDTQIEAAFVRLLRWMVAEPVHAKLLNRIFLDNPASASVAARRYWLPLMARLTEVFPADFPMAQEDLRLSVLFIINSIFQMAVSIELQVLLVGERINRNELCRRYEIIVAEFVRENFGGRVLANH